MTPTQFEKELQSLSREALIKLFLTFFKSDKNFRAVVSEYFMTPTERAAAAEKNKKLAAKNLKNYIRKLQHLFDTTPPNSPSFQKVEKLLSDFIHSTPAPSEADIALFKLHYAEGCIDELDAWGNGPEELEDLALENYRAALDYAKKDEAFFFDNLQLLYDVAATYPGADYFREYLQELVYPKMWDAGLLLARIAAVVGYYDGDKRYSKKSKNDDSKKDNSNDNGEVGEVTDMLESRVRLLLRINASI